MREIWDVLSEKLGANFAEDKTLQANIVRMSRAFTEDRADLPADYLEDEEAGAAYLAYYLPLNFEKARTLLTAHAKEIWPETPKHVQRWADFGCGPGTATLAALGALKLRFKGEKPPAVHVDLIDQQQSALDLAEELIETFATRVGLKATIHKHKSLPAHVEYDLSLAANVLNELPPAEEGEEGRELLMQLWHQTKGSFFVMEPGHRVSSQRLVRFRERVLKENREGTNIIGPCPHVEKCPVYRTPNWCHFSEPVQDGRLIDLNLRVFKDKRSWLKFSYVLFTRGAPKKFDGQTYRAIGDLHIQRGQTAIDLCQPNEKWVLYVPKNIPPLLRSSLVRGASVRIHDNRKITAIPLSKRKETRK